MPEVSIIVPVYKAQKYLERCVNSLVNQTLRDIEIILVDDASPDESGALCDKFAAEDSRIKVIHKENEGPGMARNSGMKIAEGEYMGFVDSDDYVDLTMYENLVEAAKKYDADLVLSGIKFVGGNTFEGEGETVKEYFAEDTLFSTKEEIDNLILGISGALPYESDDSRYGMSVCKTLFKREVAEKNGLKFMAEREILSEDTLFMIDFASEISKAVGVKEAYYYYCRNGESISKSYNATRFERSMVFVKELEKRLLTRVPKDVYGIYLNRLTQAFGRVLGSQEVLYAKDKNLSYKELKKRLSMICEREEIKEALKSYPIHKLPKKQALFAFLMKHKLYFLQKTAVLLRDK